MYRILFFPLLLLLRFLMWAAFRDSPVSAVSWSQPSKWQHPVSEYSDSSLLYLAQTDDGHMLDFNDTLDEILRPRVPDTEGSRKVRQYLTNSMKELGWQVEEDAFESRTPMGTKHFTNVIATLDPSACRNLVLACHYDSKISREDSFLGATDSAVPCAMLVHLARGLKDALQDNPLKGNISLQMLFLDGEEAFKEWSDRDSLYGARHLAELWNKSPATTSDENKVCRRRGEAMVSRLDQIDVFVLLDLLGSPNPQFYSFFQDTFSLYKRLPIIEKKLNDLGMIETPAPQTRTKYFANRSSFSFVEDDHIPFMQRGVPIIHLIPVPFPSVWHKDSDNRDNLHHPTINNLNKIIRVFVSQYLHLNPELYARQKL